MNNLIILNYLRYAYQVTPTILNMIMVTTKQKFDLHDQYINQPEKGSEIHTTTTWYAIASLTILTNDKCLKLYWYPIFYIINSIYFNQIIRDPALFVNIIKISFIKYYICYC